MPCERAKSKQKRIPAPPPPIANTGIWTIICHKQIESWLKKLYQVLSLYRGGGGGPRDGLRGCGTLMASVCTVIFTCTHDRFNGPSLANILRPDVPCPGVGLFDHIFCPWVGFYITFDPTLVYPAHHLDLPGVPLGM